MKFTHGWTVFALAWTALAIGPETAASAAHATNPSAVEIVRQAVNNECSANGGRAKFMFADHKQTARGSQTRLIAEANEATAGMLVAVDDKPLTPEQRQAEMGRLQMLADNPQELGKKQRAERDDAERTTRIVRALPDAFLFESDGTEIGTDNLGKPGDELVRLKFRPNPSYTPPSHTEQVLTGMQGYILIDENEHRIAKIDGTLFKEVGFGWGILGHLNRGGHFLVQQADVGSDHWEVTRMSLALTGKELFFKSINIKQDEVCSDFRPLPSNLNFAQAVDLLKRRNAELAQNHEPNGSNQEHK